MNTPLYKVGDLVKITSNPWNQHAGNLVIIAGVSTTGEIPVYDFLIPEQRGSVPQQLIEKLIMHDVKVA